ncbi:MAG TPA: DUF5666 domain-containing protein [Terriglobales bacterium]|nr:DUF5666 domain-containing protein [Terriglobales bacterium]
MPSFRILWAATTAAALLLAAATTLGAQPAIAQSKPDAVSKAVGTIKSVQSNSVIVAAESGGDITATLAPSTKILRVPPGEKDLKSATPLQPQDLQPGDRVLVRGQASSDGHTIAALAVIVMKQADVSAQHQRETEDWQKHGVGGLVTAIDAVNRTITISSGGLGPAHNIAIHTTKATILRRYATGSTKFDDAKPAPLSDIKSGDQLRARGTRSPDGNELAADEIVSGSFRNIAGTITAVDAASNTITVHDLIARNSVVVKFSPESQLKKLSADLAQHVAMRLKSGANGNQSAAAQNSSAPAGGGSAASPGGTRNGLQDPQRMLSRLPNSTLADLQKGEAVMIVSTLAEKSGDNSGAVTAITLLAGVEPILTAAPSSMSLLSPWSLSTGGEGDSAP